MHRPIWIPFLLLLPLVAALVVTPDPVHALAPRDGRLLTPRQDLNISIDKLGCGRFATADYRDVKDLLDAMHPSQPDDCTTPGHTCRRVACKNTSAVYVCNDWDDEIVLSCADDVARFADWIYAYCCHNTPFYKGLSGQVFDDVFGDKGRGYNVAVAYGNCNHDKDADNPSMGPPDYPWGPNGVCRA